MPGKNSKQTTAKTETPVAPVETKVEAAPAKTEQKGGKKAAKVEATPAPVAEVKAEAPAKTEQKGGKKAAKAEAAPVAEVKPEAPAKGTKKAAEAKKAEAPAKTEQKGGKKAEVKKAEKPAKKEKVEEAAEEDDESGDRRIRSFKVKLPGKEEFEGRFTGLTPYQAANKALSKYFRETEKPKAEITFSICESTRKSKKAVYTYIGKRQKLDTPVTYKIQDGREIVKNFKNSLKKVKKSEATESA
jgi:hypothetical protein